MTYREAIRYLESLINYEKIPAYPYEESLKLERVRDFLKLIGNPQDALPCVHIAGTKGKGSTCVFVTYILREAGYKVGLYTSPHLSDFRERIRILAPRSKRAARSLSFEGMIPKKALLGLIRKLKFAIDRYNKTSKYGPLSFFEVYTALAFCYFKAENADFMILETGLGGRLDATNVVNPLACGITSLSYEHTQKLGKTLKEIATEKAGIIKIPDAAVISAPQKKEAGEIIRKKCKIVGAKLYVVNKDIFYQKAGKGFSIKGIIDTYPNLKIKLLGRHQRINASLAVGIIEALRFHNIKINVNSVRKGLDQALWPGRCEVVSKKPFVVLDGAQNVASAKALKETIKENFKYKNLILVLGISKDKDIRGICEQLKSLARKVILTKADTARAAEPKVLAKYFSAREHYLTGNIRQALKLAKNKAGFRDLILVTGSLFVVGEARSLYNNLYGYN